MRLQNGSGNGTRRVLYLALSLSLSLLTSSILFLVRLCVTSMAFPLAAINGRWAMSEWNETEVIWVVQLS